MSRRIWTKQGKVIITIIIATIVIFFSFGGWKAISKMIKEINIKKMLVPNSAPENISQIIQGKTYESLKSSFNKENNRSNKYLGLAKELEKRYPKDSRPQKNREAWENHIVACEKQFFLAIYELFNKVPEIIIEASSFNELKREYNQRVKNIDERIAILSNLSKKYSSNVIKELESKLNNFKQNFRNKQYNCPEHESYCMNCISTESTCAACGGNGRWGFLNWTCQLCSGSGKICAPMETYCNKCKGRWDKGANCQNCKKGLIPCPAHDERKTKCPNCKTINGVITGQILEQ